MSSTAPWLSRQRKTDLTEMAEAAGMKDFKSLRKTELEELMDNFLRANQTTLGSNPKLADFYKRVKDGSPSTAATGKELVKSETKTPSKPRRKTITPKEDVVSESEATSDANTLRTPARPSVGVASQIPLPPSPAVVAQQIEVQTQRFSSWVNKEYARTGVQQHVEWTREQVSTSYSITTISVALEAFVILTTLLPMQYFGVVIPAIPALGLPEYHTKAPRFWNLLEGKFWSTTFLWAMVSVFAPGFVAYFFNLARKARRSSSKSFDPFTFNVAKALFTWLVFVQHVGLPTTALAASRDAIVTQVPGTYFWTMTSAIVCGLVSLWEAVLARH